MVKGTGGACAPKNRVQKICRAPAPNKGDGNETKAKTGAQRRTRAKPTRNQKSITQTKKIRQDDHDARRREQTRTFRLQKQRGSSARGNCGQESHLESAMAGNFSQTLKNRLKPRSDQNLKQSSHPYTLPVHQNCPPPPERPDFPPPRVILSFQMSPKVSPSIPPAAAQVAAQIRRPLSGPWRPPQRPWRGEMDNGRLMLGASALWVRSPIDA